MTQVLGFVFLVGGGWLVAGVLVWQLSVTKRAKLAARESQAYQDLAVQATEAAERTSKELARVNGRLEELEKILGEVG